MTIRPFYEPRILEMRIEKYAEIAVDAGIWLAGEMLEQGIRAKGDFLPDPRYVYKPRQMEAAIIELSHISEGLRHRIFAAGFLKLPNNGAQATLHRLLETHTEMLHVAFRIEWKRRHGKMAGAASHRTLRRGSNLQLTATTIGRRAMTPAQK